MHCQTKAPLQLSWKVIGEIQKKKIQKRKTKIFLSVSQFVGLFWAAAAAGQVQ